MDETPGFRSDLRHAIKLHKHASCQRGDCAYCSSGAAANMTGFVGPSGGLLRKHSSSSMASSLLGVTRYEIQKTEIELEASSKKSNLTISVTPSGPLLEAQLGDDSIASPRWRAVQRQLQRDEERQQSQTQQQQQQQQQWDGQDRSRGNSFDEQSQQQQQQCQQQQQQQQSPTTLASSLPAFFAAALSPLSLGQRSASSSVSSIGSLEEQKSLDSGSAPERAPASTKAFPQVLHHATVRGSLHNPATCTNSACAYCAR